MNSSDIIRRLILEGWKQVHVAGSHHKFKHPGKPGHVVVPHPKRDLPGSLSGFGGLGENSAV